MTKLKQFIERENLLCLIRITKINCLTAKLIVCEDSTQKKSCLSRNMVA